MRKAQSPKTVVNASAAKPKLAKKARKPKLETSLVNDMSEFDSRPNKYYATVIDPKQGPCPAPVNGGNVHTWKSNHNLVVTNNSETDTASGEIAILCDPRNMAVIDLHNADITSHDDVGLLKSLRKSSAIHKQRIIAKNARREKLASKITGNSKLLKALDAQDGFVTLSDAFSQSVTNDPLDPSYEEVGKNGDAYLGVLPNRTAQGALPSRFAGGTTYFFWSTNTIFSPDQTTQMVSLPDKTLYPLGRAAPTSFTLTTSIFDTVRATASTPSTTYTLHAHSADLQEFWNAPIGTITPTSSTAVNVASTVPLGAAFISISYMCSTTGFRTGNTSISYAWTPFADLPNESYILEAKGFNAISPLLDTWRPDSASILGTHVGSLIDTGGMIAGVSQDGSVYATSTQTYDVDTISMMPTAYNGRLGGSKESGIYCYMPLTDGMAIHQPIDDDWTSSEDVRRLPVILIAFKGLQVGQSIRFSINMNFTARTSAQILGPFRLMEDVTSYNATRALVAVGRNVSPNSLHLALIGGLIRASSWVFANRNRIIDTAVTVLQFCKKAPPNAITPGVASG